MNRAEALAALREALRAELAAVAWAAGMARDEATSAESRPENQYDTRALEASYLAAGQGERLAAARALAAWSEALDDAPRARAGPGAFARLAGPGGPRWVVFAPRGGGAFRVGGVAVEILSATSPIGEALAGAEPGDEAEVDGPGGVRAWEVLAVT